MATPHDTTKASAEQDGAQKTGTYCGVSMRRQRPEGIPAGIAKAIQRLSMSDRGRQAAKMIADFCDSVTINGLDSEGLGAALYLLKSGMASDHEGHTLKRLREISRD